MPPRPMTPRAAMARLLEAALESTAYQVGGGRPRGRGLPGQLVLAMDAEVRAALGALTAADVPKPRLEWLGPVHAEARRLTSATWYDEGR